MNTHILNSPRRHTMTFQHTLKASLAILLITSSGLALAGPDKEKSRDSTILKGPSVNITPPAKDRDSMQSMKENKGMQGDRPVGFRDYLIALRQMRNQDGSSPLALSQKQQDEIKSIMQDHREAMKKFQEKNKDKIQSMRKAQGSNEEQKKANRKRNTIERADKPSRDKQGGQDAQNAREKLRSFMENAPANQIAFARIRAILSVEQQSTIKEHIKQASERRAKGGERPDRARRSERQQRQQDQQSDRKQGERPDQAKRRANRQAEDENDRPKRARIQHKDIDSEKTKRATKQKRKQSKSNRSDKPENEDD